VVYALYTDMFRGLPRDGEASMRLSDARVVLTGASGIGLAIAPPVRRRTCGRGPASRPLEGC
jgi:hypothetical protein